MNVSAVKENTPFQELKLSVSYSQKGLPYKLADLEIHLVCLFGICICSVIKKNTRLAEEGREVLVIFLGQEMVNE